MQHENHCRLCDLAPEDHLVNKSLFGVYPGCDLNINFFTKFKNFVLKWT
ncbi:MAG: hypothetical protein P8K05_04820 [Dehalococcoidia bacterium]|jgi:hypothetical protein|nr:hypothetical protein [Dehalococcoidia bacterium]